MTSPELRLLPPAAKGHTSAARVTDDWYVACASRELRDRPLAVTVLGVPLALYRAEDGSVGALLDRCPHRNVPLSTGNVKGPHLECGYHGWQFDAQGACQRVPSLCSEGAVRGRRVQAFACREQDGYVWVYGEPDVEPARDPFRLPLVDTPGYHTVRDAFVTAGTLHAVAENALDVPHTRFLHSGLFRKDGPGNVIDVVLRRWPDRVEAEYIGEPRPEGLVGRLLAPQGGVVEHFDRFILPCVAQVEYRLGEKSHVVVSSLLTPIDDFTTKLWAAVTFKLPVPAWLVKLVAKPVGRRIFAQDAEVLKVQADAIRRFGGEQYMSTEIDVLGPSILKLLRAAERGDRTLPDATADRPSEKRFQMEV
ncbi:MAG: aromatic ring-hydroxylating dioxygenase subunit alpha [Myxococcales bacterium]|nr:aromatic ring-hydroxylating dioxygenase subunit alpha [Myxococcales bacterium]